MMNGDVIAYQSTGQTTKSNTTTEAETKAIAVSVAMASALTDLHGEFANVEHGPVRLMTDSAGAVSVITRGLNTKTCASYKRAQHMAEEPSSRGRFGLILSQVGTTRRTFSLNRWGALVIFTTRAASFRGRSRIYTRARK